MPPCSKVCFQCPICPVKRALLHHESPSLFQEPCKLLVHQVPLWLSGPPEIKSCIVVDLPFPRHPVKNPHRRSVMWEQTSRECGTISSRPVLHGHNGREHAYMQMLNLRRVCNVHVATLKTKHGRSVQTWNAGQCLFSEWPGAAALFFSWAGVCIQGLGRFVALGCRPFCLAFDCFHQFLQGQPTESHEAVVVAHTPLINLRGSGGCSPCPLETSTLGTCCSLLGWQPPNSL